MQQSRRIPLILCPINCDNAISIISPPLKCSCNASSAQQTQIHLTHPSTFPSSWCINCFYYIPLLIALSLTLPKCNHIFVILTASSLLMSVPCTNVDWILSLPLKTTKPHSPSLPLVSAPNIHALLVQPITFSESLYKGTP